MSRQRAKGVCTRDSLLAGKASVSMFHATIKCSFRRDSDLRWTRFLSTRVVLTTSLRSACRHEQRVEAASVKFERKKVVFDDSAAMEGFWALKAYLHRARVTTRHRPYSDARKHQHNGHTSRLLQGEKFSATDFSRCESRRGMRRPLSSSNGYRETISSILGCNEVKRKCNAKNSITSSASVSADPTTSSTAALIPLCLRVFEDAVPPRLHP